MSLRTFRTLTGISGILGVIALGMYYSVPLPLPPNAGIQEIMDFGAHFHNRILLDAWFQAIGSFLMARGPRSSLAGSRSWERPW
jgi:hypothetical protein